MFEVNCECGRIIPVQTGQAGDTIACSCGRPVAIPSLGELRKAAVAQGMPIYHSPPEQDWGAWWVGVGLVLAGYTIEFMGAVAIAVNPRSQAMVFTGGTLIGLGYILRTIGILTVGLGKGFAVWLCLVLCFCVPLGFLVVLFVPGKGTDKE